MTGSGYNGDGDVLCNSQRVAYDSHPSIAKIIEVKHFSYYAFTDERKWYVVQVGSVCNNAEIVNSQLRGQPTEGALLAVALKVCGKPRNVLQEKSCVFLFEWIDKSSSSSWTISTWTWMAIYSWK